jgi:hypothetical protein
LFCFLVNFVPTFSPFISQKPLSSCMMLSLLLHILFCRHPPQSSILSSKTIVERKYLSSDATGKQAWLCLFLCQSCYISLTTVCPWMFVPTSNLVGTAIDPSLSCCIAVCLIVAGTVLGLLLLVTSLNTMQSLRCYLYFLTHYFPSWFIFMAKNNQSLHWKLYQTLCQWHMQKMQGH